MSRDYNFFIEYEKNGVWLCPQSLVRKAQGVPYADSLFSIPKNSPVADLFFSENSLFDVHSGVPSLPMSKEVSFRVGGQVSDLWWVYFDELMFENWESSFVIVSSEVESCYASCFGKGKEVFPEKALIEKGMQQKDLIVLRDYLSAVSLVNRPINHDYEMYEKPDGVVCEVSWKKSIANFIGYKIVDKITHIYNKYGEDSLRFIVGWG